MSYTHLHLHTEYSLLDGANKVGELARTLKEYGYKSVAITDHGTMFGAIDFYKTMRKEGIKPIIGIETYIHDRSELGDKDTKTRWHLCLYAKDKEGYENLMYLSSMAYMHGFYYKPRINKDLLRLHSRGLVCSSACLQGEIAWHLNLSKNQKYGARGYVGAKEAALWYKDVFGDDFYLEIMRHGIGNQLDIEDDLLRLSKELDIKLIATNDTHYTFKDRADAHEIFMCIATGKKLQDKQRLRHDVCEFYLKTEEQMRELFLDMPEAIDNTQEIADKCNLELKLGEPTAPNFKFSREYSKEFNIPISNPDSEFDLTNDNEVFEELSKRGLEERLKYIDKDKHDEYRKRLQTEIDIIKKMKFSGYMLIVADFIKAAKDNGVPVGPGRGSAAGSLVAYSLKITDIDPLPYSLLFERFLNPERISMPDIDVDFCQFRRGEVIKYVVEKYGRSKVAQVVTFGKLLAKGVIRDVGRVLDVSLPDVDALTKLIPDELKITLEKAYEKEPKIAEFITSLNNNPKYAGMYSEKIGDMLWRYSLALEGLNRNAGTHAAGVVISNEDLWKKTPVFKLKAEEDDIATQYDKDLLEDVDLIKFDFLGLKTLTVIDNSIKQIKKNHGVDINWHSIDVNDKGVYETIQSGNTLGIFQIESAGMQDLNARLKPECFEDVVAVLALFRPGPLESGMVDDFIDIKHGRKEAFYAFAELKPILENTYGVIVYQEQVMQIVQAIGGFSLGGADLVRRAMGKKKPEEMAKLKGEYLAGAVKKGFDEKKADDLWELIVKFAGYGFNKSHSAAYAMIAFQTAYLKTYYPNEFMAALLTSEQGNVDKILKYKDELNRLGIKLLPPDINNSFSEFSVVKGQNAITFGLGAVKSANSSAVDYCIMEREKNGRYESFNEFLNRTLDGKVNRKTFEVFSLCGVFDCFGYSRKTLYDNLDYINTTAMNIRNSKEKSKESLFADENIYFVDITLENGDEFDNMIKLNYEKEILGAYASGHPLDEFSELVNKYNYTKSCDFDELEDGEGDINCIGKIQEFKTYLSKSGKRYAKLTIMDFYYFFDVIIFEKSLPLVEEILDGIKQEYRQKLLDDGKEVDEKLLEDDLSLINEVFLFKLRYKKNGKEKSFIFNELKNLKEVDVSEVKVAKTRKKHYMSDEKSFEKVVLDVDMDLLTLDKVRKIYSMLERLNKFDKGDMKIFLNIIEGESCAHYDTMMSVSADDVKRVREFVDSEIMNKSVG